MALSPTAGHIKIPAPPPEKPDDVHPEVWLQEHPDQMPPAEFVRERLLHFLEHFEEEIEDAREAVRKAERRLVMLEGERAGFRGLLDAAMASHEIASEDPRAREEADLRLATAPKAGDLWRYSATELQQRHDADYAKALRKLRRKRAAEAGGSKPRRRAKAKRKGAR